MAGKMGLLVAGFKYFSIFFDGTNSKKTGLLGDLLPMAMDVGVQVS